MNKTTAFIFFGIILVGLAISLFTLKGCGEKVAPEEVVIVPAVGLPKESGDKPALDSPPVKPEKPEPEKAVSPAPATPPAPDPSKSAAFKTPDAAMRALAEKIGAKDYPGFAALAGPGAISPEIEAKVKALIEDPQLKLDPAKPHVEISKSAEGLRWAFNFVPSTGEGAVRQLYTDLATLPDEALDIAKVSLPIDLGPARGTPAAAGVPAAPADALGIPAAIASADALTVAHAFSQAVVRRDFKMARELADPGAVTDERVAALMIAVEEGKFRLREDRPLVVTLSRDDITWVLARVQSESAASEFAVELGKLGEAWKVNGLTFSKVLSALSEAAGGGDVAYSPIVEDPEGGDSLVLYFEFDEAGLNARSERQLAIVADILSQGSERVIRINGHADALGSDNYNVALSDRRAEAIRQALIRMGVKPDQVVTEAFGAAKPRKPNFLPDGSDNPSGRSQNRRAEVLLDF
ncbi:MAG: OmpA family protein [Verrucomicrobiae bacterium]|nr:OmpA family protein [Verrucomicrobiae bacterium]